MRRELTQAQDKSELTRSLEQKYFSRETRLSRNRSASKNPRRGWSVSRYREMILAARSLEMGTFVQLLMATLLSRPSQYGVDLADSECAGPSELGPGRDASARSARSESSSELPGSNPLADVCETLQKMSAKREKNGKGGDKGGEGKGWGGEGYFRARLGFQTCFLSKPTESRLGCSRSARSK